MQRGGSRRRGGFVEKTIAGAAGVLRQALFSEDTAAGGGLLQRIDARVKVVTVAVLLVAVALTRHIPVLLAAYAVTVALAAASKLPVRFFVKRVWLFIPLFTGIVVLPATLSVITPGRVVVPVGTWCGHDVGVTAPGLRSAGLIVSRVATSISLVLLLTLTTPWNRLLAALRSLAVPRVFVLVMAMAYRYVFHLLHAVTDMYTARKSRMPSSDRDVRGGRAFVSATAGALFGRANALADEVHLAMVSRGFTGEVRTLDRSRVRALDWAWAVAALVAAFVVVGGDRALGR